MKPLELTIYECGDCGDTRCFVIDDDKRFADAELAAEFEAARCDYLLSEATGHFWAPLGETWSSDHASAGRRVSTLLRLATLPHYDEEPQS